MTLRERLKNGILNQLTEVYVNGHPSRRLPGNMNMSFAYVEGESLLMGLKEIAVSTGSACTSASLEPSYVLRAIGIEEELAHTSIRFGLGRFNTEDEVDYTIRRVVEEVRRLRETAPAYKTKRMRIERRQQVNIKAQERVS
jgi:cysteine desulfurase